MDAPSVRDVRSSQRQRPLRVDRERTSTLRNFVGPADRLCKGEFDMVQAVFFVGRAPAFKRGFHPRLAHGAGGSVPGPRRAEIIEQLPDRSGQPGAQLGDVALDGSDTLTDMDLKTRKTDHIAGPRCAHEDEAIALRRTAGAVPPGSALHSRPVGRDPVGNEPAEDDGPFSTHDGVDRFGAGLDIDAGRDAHELAAFMVPPDFPVGRFAARGGEEESATDRLPRPREVQKMSVTIP
jgi:hypothetical protein